MAMDDDQAGRRHIIATAITAELERQNRDGVQRVDVDALADAIEAALVPPSPPSEGKRPEDLNATNDD